MVCEKAEIFVVGGGGLNFWKEDYYKQSYQGTVYGAFPLHAG